MATNYIQEGKTLKLGVTASAESGAADLVGDLAVVLLEDADDSDEAVCAIEGVFDLSVTGENNSGNAAISVGDKIYYDGGTLNVDAIGGTFFGHALEAVSSGATDTIKVRLKQ